MPKIDPRRIDAAEELWTQQWNTRAIEGELASRFKVTKRQARRYLSIARRRIAAREQLIPPEQRVAQIDSMFIKAFEAAEIPNIVTGQPNASAMVAAAHRRAEMFGVLAPKKLELDATVTGIADLLSQAFDEGAGEGGKGPLDQ